MRSFAHWIKQQIKFMLITSLKLRKMSVPYSDLSHQVLIVYFIYNTVQLFCLVIMYRIQVKESTAFTVYWSTVLRLVASCGTD